ncbi:carbon-nitrogen hydrolase family protein [Candidatus Woesearchaeota archaeon]|nr:carbon-nitrogen hydrolase family protein [Candidatus Woesearchaeota archaeon]
MISVKIFPEWRISSGKNNCDIICFPEVFLTAGMSRKKYNPEIPKQAKGVFSSLCRNYGIFGVMGSIADEIGSKLYNVSYLFDNNGQIIGNYRKNHLVQNTEAKRLKAGNEANVFRTKVGNIGLEICRDLLYPEITRKLMLKKADIVFCPSFWCSKSSQYSKVYNYKYFRNKIPDEVTKLVSARAIESETVFVYANAAGTFNYNGTKNILLGKTQIALPFYGTVGILNHNRESVLIREVDLGIVNDARKVYKIEQDLKDYYKG